MIAGVDEVEVARIGQLLAQGSRDRIDAILTESLLGYVNAAPPQPATLTMEDLYRAYDAAWDIPDEPYWYLCHPDNLEWARSVVGADAPGKHTCPIVRASDWCPPGKMIRVEWGELAKFAKEYMVMGMAVGNERPDSTTSIHDANAPTTEPKVQPHEPRKSKAALRQVRHQKPKRRKVSR